MNILATNSVAAQAVMQNDDDDLFQNHMKKDDFRGNDDDDKSSKENSSSHEHSSSHPSTTDFGSKTGEDETVSEVNAATKQDTKNVNRAKFLVYLSLLFAAASVGTLTFIFTKSAETYSFHQKVHKGAIALFGAWLVCVEAIYDPAL
jgi:hypothetical protein